MAHLSKNNSTAAFELFIEISEGTQVFEQPQILECGLNALSVALNNDNLGADMLRVVHFMLECEIKVGAWCSRARDVNLRYHIDRFCHAIIMLRWEKMQCEMNTKKEHAARKPKEKVEG